MSSRVEKIEKSLEQAREIVTAADRRVHELGAAFKRSNDNQKRIGLITRLSDALAELQKAGGSDPFSGDTLSKDTYGQTLARITEEVDEYRATVGKLKEELNQAQMNLAKATTDYDRLSKKLAEQEKKRRQAVLDEYRREIAEKGFQAREDDIFYRPMSLPWSGKTEDDRRVKRISALVFLFTLLLSVVITIVVVPEIEKEEVELPSRLAKLIVEREKQKEPLETAQERKLEKKDLKAREKAPEPKTAEQQRARDRARQSGLLALSDTFESLKQSAFEEKLGTQAAINTAGRKASNLERSIVSSRAETGSGGIVTSSLSRGTGGSALSGRSTSRVSSSLATSADRRIVGSGSASRTDEEIQIVFDRNKSALYRLYNRELRKDPRLQGKIVLKLTIAPSGQVTMCIVKSSSMKAPELERKIAQRVKLFNFGSKKVSAVTITYPIDFLPS